MLLPGNVMDIRRGLSEGRYNTEIKTENGIVLHLLEKLDWVITDTDSVSPARIRGKTEYLLCCNNHRILLTIDRKGLKLKEKEKEDLFVKAFEHNAPLSILTDGQIWWFLLLGENGESEDCIVCNLDMIETDPDEITDTFNRYLSKRSVCTGKSLEEAKGDYLEMHREEIVQETLCDAWNELVSGQDLDEISVLLMEKAEAFGNIEVTEDDCRRFFENAGDSLNVAAPNKANKKRPEIPHVIHFKGETYKEIFRNRTLIKLFQLLHADDSTFLERFSGEDGNLYGAGKLISKNRLDLNKKQRLAKEKSESLVPGWYIYRTFSSERIRDFADAAISCARDDIRSSIKIEWGYKPKRGRV